MTRRSATPKTFEDPVVEEIRAIRRRLFKKAGGTTEGYAKLVREMASQVRQSGSKKTTVRRRKSA